MSTELNEIGCRIERIRTDTKEIFYSDANFKISTFFGGENKGTMIQITPNIFPSPNHIQLDREQVKALINTLIEWL